MTNNNPNLLSDGPIDISETSTITPITQQPIASIDANSWQNISLTELHEQLSALQNRYYSALEMERYEIANSIQAGIAQLRIAIEHKINNQTRREII